MTRILHAWLWYLLASPIFSHAAVTLPMAEAPAASPALRVAMAGLLDDYANRLPAQFSLVSLQDEAGQWHGWSVRRDALLILCRDHAAACADWLPAQFDALMNAWLKLRDDTAFSLAHAVTLSALADLCEFSWDWRSEMGNRCLPRQVRFIAATASSIWNGLGYQHLMLAFLHKEVEQQNTLATWIKQNTALTSAQQSAELEELAGGSMIKHAIAAEITGDTNSAFGQWAAILSRLLLADKDRVFQVQAMANMARLSAQLGRLDRAGQWLKFAQETVATLPDARFATCYLQAQQLDVDIDLPPGEGAPVDGQRRLRALIAQDCPFTAQSLHLAFAALRQGRAADAAAGLTLAEQACGAKSQCGYSRMMQIGQLLQVARADPDGLRRVAAYWRQRFQSADTLSLLAVEVDIAWALVERLHTMGAHGDALALVDPLERHVSNLRALRFAPASVARYDELTRLRAKLSVLASGTSMPVDATEGLRSQRLLRQLQLARWKTQLAGVDEPEARAELLAWREKMAQLRVALAGWPTGQQERLRMALEYLRDELMEQDIVFDEAYASKLAAKHLGKDGRARLTAAPLSSYEKTDFSASWAETQGLGAGDAYLSWLRVPGGFIGTLLAAPLRDVQGKPMEGPHHPIQVSQQFIAFSAQDEALLRLHRQMLTAGVGVQRGIRLTAPIESSRDGLMVDHQPLWLMPDASFAVGDAPPGARRVREFSVLSDALYNRLLAPFAHLYQDAERLMISPDGALAYLPFETLTRQRVPVLEAIDIGYVQSLAVLGELKKRAHARRPGGASRMLSVADPDYGPAPTPGAGGHAPAAAWPRLVWQPLPGTRAESDALSRLFRQPRQLLGKTASKAALDGLNAKGELRQYQVLHFATHGYVDAQRSALVISPGQAGDSAYLGDGEILQWQLESDLTLLSACNTGIGRDQQGEGIVGLPYAFFMAGNINTLMSLWPVDDAGTAALIPAYMQRLLRGEDSVAALNNTKRAFARGDYGPLLRNPRIWSAFVLYGAPLAMLRQGR